MGNKISPRKSVKTEKSRRNIKNRITFVDQRLNTYSDEHDGLTRHTNITKRPSYQGIAALNRTVSSLKITDHLAMLVEPKNYNFDFENIVLEGGGNKGLAYCGAIAYLQEVGIMKNIKRIAGASAGAMTAALVVVGYSSDEIEDFLGNNISDVFIDHSCGYCSLLPNLLSGYGWNPGKKIFKWFGEKMNIKTGKADITFQEVYELTGKELCVVVTNLSQMSTEYCHPKTTPDMSVRLAVRMSMAIPGLFSAMKYNANGQTDVYVDGGVLCNYPIHCFDGWFLSTAPGDSFMERLHPLSELSRLYDKSERFGKVNHKTLGLLLFADSDRDVLRYNLEKRIGVLEPRMPAIPTKLYSQKAKKKMEQKKIEIEHERVVQAVDAFLSVLRKYNLDNNDIISKSELEAAFSDEQLTKDQIILLFGEDIDYQTAFDMLDKDQSGEIKYNELVQFIESTGICFQTRFLGYQRNEVTNFASFLDSLQSTLLTNVKKIYVDDKDLNRTVGINTGHVGTSDFNCEEADIEFVVQRGYNATKAFLQYHVANNTKVFKPIDTLQEDILESDS